MQPHEHTMRHNNQLREISIKVPAPFAGVSDLGFTAQYRAQDFQQPMRDVPLVIEGPRPPMRRLAELLLLEEPAPLRAGPLIAGGRQDEDIRRCKRSNHLTPSEGTSEGHLPLNALRSRE